MNVREHRPTGYSEREVETIIKVAKSVYSLLLETQKHLTYRTLKLNRKQLEELSLVIVEFVEDVFTDIGIWKSLEWYNKKYFKNPLTFCYKLDQNILDKGISKPRIHYLLWNKYSELIDDLILSPTHQDLVLIVESVFNFFQNFNKKIFSQLSSIKSFLQQPNQFGWKVKRKLLWLGQHSYLFRHSYDSFIKENGGEPKISLIDDFVCQHTTTWSGLGVIDILGAILNISKKQQKELLSWYERHFGYFQIKEIKQPIVFAQNVICEKTYSIRADDQCYLFKPGHLYAGNLVPWNEEWYWSGQQSYLGELPENDLQALKEEFLEKAPQIAYRYCKSLLEKAQNSIKIHYQNFIKFFGDDLVIFSDGYSMAAAIQNQHKKEYESHPERVINDMMQRHNLKNPWPTYNFPMELLESVNGIGLYFNPVEGQEIMRDFYDVLTGFKKRGKNLTEDEMECIRGFIESPAISTNFVKKLVKKYGAQSIGKVYLILESKNMDYLNFILRKYKGHFFRKRYPTISFK
jgi:hypothetical protein